jgi:hypothetical protein
MVANEDKFITRLLITSLVGSFTGFPVIKAPTHGTNKGKTQLLSGLTNIVESTGSFSVTLGCDHFTDANDLALIETIYNSRKAFNFWLCGGDDTQFTYPLKGYRKEDIYLMRPDDDYRPELYKSIYKCGVMQDIKLVEAVR